MGIDRNAAQSTAKDPGYQPGGPALPLPPPKPAASSLGETEYAPRLGGNPPRPDLPEPDPARFTYPTPAV